MSTWPFSYEILDARELTVDHTYQRPLTSFVNRVVDKFDPALVGTLQVSRRRDGTLVVVDGQTRAEAIRRLYADDKLASPAVPSVLYTGLDRKAEAKLFAKLQKERKGIASYHRFRADVVAEEPEALAIQAIVDAAGHVLGEGGKPGNLSAVAALEKVYRYGADTLIQTLAVIREAWDDWVPDGNTLKGIGRVLDREQVDRGELANRLGQIPPSRIRMLAMELSEGTGSAGGGGGFDVHMAKAIMAIYTGEAATVVERAVRAVSPGSPSCKAKSCRLAAVPGREYCGGCQAKANELRAKLAAA